MQEKCGSTVLVVEDNDMVREMSRAVLESAGFAVLTAASAEECEQTVAACRLDLVLMDRGLPGCDGYELARRLKAAAPTRDLTILAFSSSDTRAADSVAIGAGCVGFVPKPYAPAALVRAVRWYLLARRAAGRPALPATAADVEV